MSEWFCIVAAGVVAVGGIVLWLIQDARENEEHKRRMLSRRFCVTCGYDVHAGGGERCPECGTPIRWARPRG